MNKHTTPVLFGNDKSFDTSGNITSVIDIPNTSNFHIFLDDSIVLDSSSQIVSFPLYAESSENSLPIKLYYGSFSSKLSNILNKYYTRNYPKRQKYYTTIKTRYMRNEKPSFNFDDDNEE